MRTWKVVLTLLLCLVCTGSIFAAVQWTKFQSDCKMQWSRLRVPLGANEVYDPDYVDVVLGEVRKMMAEPDRTYETAVVWESCSETGEFRLTIEQIRK